eukprot:6197843-Pleurochrysis_carterae.AAC.6
MDLDENDATKQVRGGRIWWSRVVGNPDPRLSRLQRIGYVIDTFGIALGYCGYYCAGMPAKGS